MFGGLLSRRHIVFSSLRAQTNGYLILNNFPRKKIVIHAGKYVGDREGHGATEPSNGIPLCLAI